MSTPDIRDDNTKIESQELLDKLIEKYEHSLTMVKLNIARRKFELDVVWDTAEWELIEKPEGFEDEHQPTEKYLIQIHAIQEAILMMESEMVTLYRVCVDLRQVDFDEYFEQFEAKFAQEHPEH